MTSSESKSDIADIAARLLGQRRLGSLTSIEPVAGGRNNRAFRVAGPSGNWLLKNYFHDSANSRDRCKSEWVFSNFCWQNGVTCVPEPIACEKESHSSLFEFVEGRRLSRDEVGESHVVQAASLISSLNHFRQSPSAREISDAAEACFSIDQHVDCVDGRIKRLGALSAGDLLGREMQTWLHDELNPVWQSIVQRVNVRFEGGIRCKELSLSDRRLSPSDFGFHNALMTSSGSLRFFDFEYAGWDDPAKLVCDFFWQQELPVPRSNMPTLVSATCDLANRRGFEERVEALMPVYGVKWCCLVLNEFLVEDRRRREFALVESVTTDRRREQLDRAKQVLKDVLTTHTGDGQTR